MDFPDALTTVYREEPCRVLANALWKTQRRLVCGNFETEVTRDRSTVASLSAYTQDMLSVYWTRRRELPLPQRLVARVRLAVLHDDYVTPEVRREFQHAERYFRLSCCDGPVKAPSLPGGFRFALVRMPAEAQAVSGLIDRCYADLRPGPETVIAWTKHPVYAPDLWIWILADRERRPVALGIAEFDDDIGEGSLEWIQVLPDYRGRGLGSALVRELLTRLFGPADFVTVSGRVADSADPERFYRRCGFRGHDVWWVLRR